MAAEEHTVSWTVLVVDDESLTRDLLRMMLERADFRVVEAEDGIDALEKIRQQPPDAVILDVMMPNMDGFVVCQTLRQNEATADLPVLMLSAKTQPEAVEEGMRAGATRYLPKPISYKDLIRHVKEVLETKVGS
jgi:CheY-like chemotaxis protein